MSTSLSESSVPARRLSKWFWPLLAVITVIAGGLRTAGLEESLWLDELHTAWVVDASTAEEFVHRAQAGNSSPAYFVLPWLSVQVLGVRELALRLPSVIAGTLLVALGFLAVRRWTGSLVCAAAAGLLLACDATCREFAHEARSYACVQLCVLTAAHLLVLSLRRTSWLHRAGLVVASLAASYLHYTAALAVAALWLGALGWMIGREIGRWAKRSPPPPTADTAPIQSPEHARRWGIGRGWHVEMAKMLSRAGEYSIGHLLVDGVILALAALPAWGHLQEIFARRENWAMFIQQRPPAAMLTLFPFGAYVGVPLLLAGVVVAWRLVAFWRPYVSPVRPAALVVCSAWLALPVAAAWLLTASDVARLFFPRYLVASLAAAIVLGPTLLGLCRPPWLRSVCITIALLFGLWQGGDLRRVIDSGRLLELRREDWRAVVEHVREHRDGLPVFVRSGLIESRGIDEQTDRRLRRFSLYPVSSIYRLDRDAGPVIPLPLAFEGRLSQDHLRLARYYGGAWIIEAHSATKPRAPAVVGGAVWATRVDFPSQPE